MSDILVGRTHLALEYILGSIFTFDVHWDKTLLAAGFPATEQHNWFSVTSVKSLLATQTGQVGFHTLLLIFSTHILLFMAFYFI